MPLSFPPDPMPIRGKGPQILDAAREVFYEHGFSLATTDMIRRRAGVSRSTLYSYYPDKKALFFAVMEAECHAVAASIRQSLDVSQTARERLIELGRRYLRHTSTRRTVHLYRVIISEAERFPGLGRMFFELGPQRAIELMSAQIKICVAEGYLSPAGTALETIARHFIDMLRGDAQIRILTAETGALNQEQMDRIAEEAVVALVRAYGPRD